MENIWEVSPLHRQVKSEGEMTDLYKIEIRDLARAFCGALFLALPLHYTMEMWARARAIPSFMLVVILVAAYLLNVGYCYYSNFKGRPARQVPWLDALESLGVGIVASTITLLLIDQVNAHMSFDVIMSCIALESVPTSFGASLAKSQLSAGNKEDDLTDGWATDKKKILACLLGGLMFAFNVGATAEPIVIATSINYGQLIGIVVFSLLVSYLMVFMTAFEKEKEDEGAVMGPQWAETLICYSVSLLASAALLFMFGYLTPTTPHNLAIPWVVVLGYATTLGGSAGRLII
ncbi:DUF2391 family protein [Neolewinella antarctica]|uniref:Integral membrane protein (TIGR02587 family) n=1 Tax=Neolewinella antarctica TaxID=442734 RepID=A0ABX0XCY4_9BACT|nr:DUF2391 family protein [Neolewinella antarctica]NJC26796.1 putative integral membrane protein (TIGR02587 family) [Neolewinella antarctica]